MHCKSTLHRGRVESRDALHMLLPGQLRRPSSQYFGDKESLNHPLHRRSWPLAPASASQAPAAAGLATARLGVDIPVELRSYTVGSGSTSRDFLLLLPDLEAVMDLYIAAG